MWLLFDSYRQLSQKCSLLGSSVFLSIVFQPQRLGQHQSSTRSWDRPHTPDHCHLELRDANHYAQCYNESLCEDRQGRDLHKTGKLHFSVISRMMFPITSLDNVVPPILQKLYEMLLHFKVL